MTDTEFWEIIEKSRQGTGSSDEQAEKLESILADLTPDDLASFDAFLAKLKDRPRLARKSSPPTKPRDALAPIDGYFRIGPEDLSWKTAEPMKIPYADYLERTKSQNLGARLWRFPPRSANTLHKHVKAEEFYFVLEGVGQIRVDGQTVTVPKYGGVLVGPESMRQVFNDTDDDVLWLMIGAPENEFGPDEKFDLKLFWPVDPKQLPRELEGHVWPPSEPGGAR